MKIPNPKLWIAVLTSLLGLIAAGAMPLLFMRFGPPGALGATADSAVTLSILSFAGLVGLIAMLTLVTCTFAALDLADHTQALGLPEGTVRAIIALGLIVIFVISSLFLFGRLAEGQTIVTKGLTSEQVAQIPGTELISKVPDKIEAGAAATFTVTRHLGPTRACEDFSRQLLTTISTLVVAISSFYFGSKAVETAQAAMSAIAQPPAAPENPPSSSPPSPPPASPPQPPPAPPTEPSTQGSTTTTPPPPTAVVAGAGATPAGTTEPPVVNEKLAGFMSKRVSPADLPESSGALERGPDGKLRPVHGDALATAFSPTSGAIGAITADHWLDTAQREPIGKGNELDPLFVVIHYTEGYSAESSVSGWREANNGILAHLLIDRDGKVFQCRPFNQTCEHAGKSRLRHPETNKLYDGLNSTSIGIEIANTGDGGDEDLHQRLKKHFPQAELITAKHRNADVPESNASEHQKTQWETYPQAQLESVFGVLKLLLAKYKIVEITGHDCVAYERKTDPGPAFPMEQLRTDNGLGGLPAVWDKNGNKIAV